MVLNELHGCVEIRGVELGGNVPAERAEVAALLDNSVQECDRVEHWLPVGQVGHVEEVRAQALECTLEARFDALRWLGCVFDRDLKQTNREFRMHFGCYPNSLKQTSKRLIIYVNFMIIK